VFQTLQASHLKKILDIELGMVQDRILNSRGEGKFVFKCTSNAKEFLLKEGTDLKYGARHLKRALERYLVYPLSNLVATSQVSLGDLVNVDYDEGDENHFSKEEAAL
jgi:ATP-dependent Clp protease ATP-binding subunit ClpA